MFNSKWPVTGNVCTLRPFVNILPRTKLGPLVAPLSELFMGQSEAASEIFADLFKPHENIGAFIYHKLWLCVYDH
jgi:hypothetical protein